MSTAIGDTLPFAVAVAISPLPIIAVILILLSQRARSNGLAFLLGWILGLAIAEGIVLVVVGYLDLSPGNSQPMIISAVKLVAGVLLIYLGIRQWQRRPKPGQPPHMPGWMLSIDTVTPMKALGLAALLSIGGNLALIVAAAVGISRAQLGVGQTIGALGAFIIIGSLTVVATVGYHIIAGETASVMLGGWKTWLLENNTTVMSVLFLVVGVLLVGKGIGGLGIFG